MTSVHLVSSQEFIFHSDSYCEVFTKTKTVLLLVLWSEVEQQQKDTGLYKSTCCAEPQNVLVAFACGFGDKSATSEGVARVKQICCYAAFSHVCTVRTTTVNEHRT